MAAAILRSKVGLPIKPRDQSTKVALTSFTEVSPFAGTVSAETSFFDGLPRSMGKPASDMGCRFVQAWWLSNCWGCNLAKASSRGPWFSRQQLRSGKGGSAWQGLTLPAFGSCRSKRSRERPAGRPALPSRLMTLGGSFMLLRAGTASLTARRRTMPCHS